MPHYIVQSFSLILKFPSKQFCQLISLSCIKQRESISVSSWLHAFHGSCMIDDCNNSVRIWFINRASKRKKWKPITSSSKVRMCWWHLKTACCWVSAAPEAVESLRARSKSNSALRIHWRLMSQYLFCIRLSIFWSGITSGHTPSIDHCKTCFSLIFEEQVRQIQYKFNSEIHRNRNPAPSKTLFKKAKWHTE